MEHGNPFMNMPEDNDLPPCEDESTLREVLRSILDTLLQLPWLKTHAGGIFLVEPDRERLRLISEIGFSDAIKQSCAQVAFGHCLCGRVACSGETLHAGCVDHRHEIRYEGMGDHGHYVVPIRHEGQVLGVLVTYVEVGHARDPGEIRVLENFAGILAQIILAHRQRLDKALADLILSHSAHGVVITDRNKRIQWVNRAFERVSGYRLEEVLGKTPAILSSGRHDRLFYQEMWRRIDRDGHWQGEIWNRRKDGRVYPEFLNIVALRDERGEVLRYAGMFVDLSPIKAAEEKIHRLAYYDAVTGLPNLSLLNERLARTLAAGAAVVLAVLDLDHFRATNAALGRRTGDALLTEIGRRLKELAGEGMAARTGASEFVLMLPCRTPLGCLKDEAERLGQRLLEALQEPFEFEQHLLVPDASIGVAWNEGKEPDGETLLRRAHLALAHCKAQARGHYLLHSAELQEAAEYRHFLHEAIAHAAERGELRLLYQPQLDREGQVTGAEALLRWEHPEKGLIPPDVFIPIAEERGAIIDIGRWVLEEGCRALGRWLNSAPFNVQAPRLAVNVSPHQLLSPVLIEDLRRLCQKDDRLTDCLEVEITETGIMESSDRALNRLAEIADLGLRIAIDDFGTGHSSLARLRHFPVQVLKIDRGFVSEMHLNPSDAALVKTIIDLAHTLGFEVVAEGVETAEQHAMLLDMGCDIFQGYHFSKPVSGEEFLEYARRRTDGPRKMVATP